MPGSIDGYAHAPKQQRRFNQQLDEQRLVFQMAEATAMRLQQEHTEPAEQVKQLMRLAYSRKAEQTEITRAIPFIKKHGLVAYCRVIFNSNELLYVDRHRLTNQRPIESIPGNTGQELLSLGVWIDGFYKPCQRQ